MDDTSCLAQCNCNNEWDGSDCSVTPAAMVSKMNLRESMMTSMTKVLDTVDDAGVVSALANVQMMVQSPNEISLASSKLAVDATKGMLKLSAKSKLPYEKLLSTLSTLDNIQAAMTKGGGNVMSTKRRLSTDTSSVLESVISMSSIIMSQMVEGQTPVTQINGNVRMSTSVVNSKDNQVKVLTPLTAMEQQSGVVPYGVAISNMTKPHAVKVTIFITISTSLSLLLL